MASVYHIAFVHETIPNIHHGGGGVTAYAMIKALIDAGHKVSVICLSPVSVSHNNKGNDDHLIELESLGAQVILNDTYPVAKPNLLSKLLPSMKNSFLASAKADWIARLVSTLNPDGVLCYHWEAIASATKIGLPKIGIVGDPLDLPISFRRAFLGRYSLSERIKSAILQVALAMRNVSLRAYMKSLLLGCDVYGAFAAHHAKGFSAIGAVSCRYFHTPVPEPTSTSRDTRKPEKLKILHIGHLAGIATLTGVELLANSVIPLLDKDIGSENYDLHLVGAFFDTMPRHLREALKKANVKIRGQVNPADYEFLTSHLIIVPTPIELGIRVRIISAMSFGCCIVAHRANSMGIPELENGVNCLLGTSGEELAELIAAVFRDSSLRNRLERASRLTYEEYFSTRKFGEIMTEEFERLLVR